MCIRDSIYNVKNLFRKTVEDATKEQMFQAVSYAVKDVIIDEWIATHKTYEKEDVKTVYYLSMEFLMGRALGNNIINICAQKEIKEVLEAVSYTHLYQWFSWKYNGSLWNRIDVAGEFKISQVFQKIVPKDP